MEGNNLFKTHKFNYQDICWVKNIKPKEGWAYAGETCEKSFDLNWSNEKSASTPKIGEVILLFQRPNQIVGKNNLTTFLTHLVTPIEEKPDKSETETHLKWTRKVKIIAIANPITSIPNPGYFNFHKPNRGQTHPIINLGNTIELSEDEKLQNIWRLFSGSFCSSLEIKMPKIVGLIDEFGELEGEKYLKEHKNQEWTRRNPNLIRKKKRIAYEKGEGHILCECCNFDFKKAYGVLGDNFIECHHKIHLNRGQRLTKYEDLALVCSNCHRMLHRIYEGGYHTIDSLSNLIESQRINGLRK